MSENTTTQGPRAGRQTASRGLPRVVRDYGVPALLVLFALVSVVVHVPQNEQISPIDEFVYSDYLDKVPTEGVVRQGEETGDYARSLVKCNGVLLYLEPDAEQCATSEQLPDGAFPFGGRTSADIYTPAYFVVTWAAAQPLIWLGVDDLLDAGSYVGFLWLAGALLFLYGALRQMAVPRLVGLALGLLVAASPAAFWSSTYVSTDAPAMTFGAAVLFVVVRLLSGRRGGGALVVLSALAVLFKVQNIAVVGMAALVLVGSGAVGLWERRRVSPAPASDPLASDAPASGSEVRQRSAVRFIVVGVLSAVLAVAVQVAWTAVRAMISVGPSPDQATGSPLSARALVRESFKFLGGIPLDPTGAANGAAISLAGFVLWAVTLGGLIGVAFVWRPLTTAWSLAWATMVIALLLGPLLVLGVSVSEGYYFPLPARYGLSLLPSFVLAAGVFLGSRPAAGRVLLAVAAPVAVLTLFGS